MKAELMAHFFFTIPAYMQTRPGTDCMATRVAAVSCHAWSPWISHVGVSLVSISCRLMMPISMCLFIRRAWPSWVGKKREPMSGGGSCLRAEEYSRLQYSHRSKAWRYWEGCRGGSAQASDARLRSSCFLSYLSRRLVLSTISQRE